MTTKQRRCRGKFARTFLFFRRQAARGWLAFGVALNLLVARPVVGAPGEPIREFATGEQLAGLQVPGIPGRVDGFLTHPSGNLIIYGDLGALTFNLSLKGLIGLLPDGRLDTNRVPELGRALCKTAVLLPDNRVVAGGHFQPAPARGTQNWYSSVVRFLPDMRIDPGFHSLFTNTATLQSVERILAQADGRLLVAGRILECGGRPANGLVRLLPDGGLDDSFAANLEEHATTNAVVVNQLALQPDGRIVVAGTFDSIDGVGRKALARLMPDGSLDENFDAPLGIVLVNELHALADGKLLLAAAVLATEVGRTNHLVLRLLPNGQQDPEFALGSGAPGNSAVHTILPNEDGSLFAAGKFTRYHGLSRSNIVRLLPDGRVADDFTGIRLQTFDNFPPPVIRTLVRQADGSILLGGQFDQIGDVIRSGYALFFPDWTMDVNFGRTGLQQARVSTLTPSGDGSVFVHGGFHYVNGVVRPALAKFLADGRLDEAFDPRQALNRSGVPVGSQPTLQPDGKLILYRYPGNPSGPLVRLNPDGSQDPAFRSSSVSVWYRPFLLQGDGKVVIGGAFTNWTDFPTMNLVRLLADGSIDREFQADLTGVSSLPIPGVLSLEVNGEGRLLAGGQGFLIRLLPDGRRDTTFVCTLPGLATSDVRTIALQQDGKILLTTRPWTGSMIAAQFARLLSDGSFDPAFSQNSVSGLVEQILVQPNGRIIVGGRRLTGTVAAQVRRNLVRLFPNGTVDLGFDAHLNAEEVDALAMDANGDIWAGLYLPDGRPRVVKLDGGSALLRIRATGTDQLTLGLNEIPGKRFVLEASTDLATWQRFQEVTMAAGGFQEFTITPTLDARFFRPRPSSE